METVSGLNKFQIIEPNTSEVARREGLKREAEELLHVLGTIAVDKDF